MIVGDRNMMKASLAKGILEIQLYLVEFYTRNLSAFGDQGALLAGFAYTAIFEAVYPNRIVFQYWFSYPYYFFSTICLISSLFIVTQSTIVTMYGPAMALSGETPESVASSVLNMRRQQTLIFKIGIVAIASLYLSGICFSWARGPIVSPPSPSLLSSPLDLSLSSSNFSSLYLFSR
jgi:hypothetical protein